MSATLVIERPPTPPRSTDGESVSVEVQSQPELDTPYTPPQIILPTLESDDSTSRPPKVEADIVDIHEGPTAQHSPQDLDSYGDPSLYQTAAPANTFYPIQPTIVRTTQLRNPPLAYNDDKIHTRSGRALGSPLSPTFRSTSRVAKSPRMKTIPKVARKSKPLKPGAPVLDEPLSILTKDYDIPLKDIDAWVHRPASERQQQATKNNDHISRPMNSFMLYRSAYADRAKHFCNENNHQVVSQVTGASWSLEPEEVRKKYVAFAEIEREAHKDAHPDYKFAPNKKGPTKRAHHELDDDDDDDDPEWQGSRSHRTRRSQTATTGTGRSQSSTPFEDRFQPAYHPTMHPSSYWASNPHGPPPMGMVPESYYQPVVNHYNQQVEEAAAIRQMQYPQYAQGPLIGMPQSSHQALLATQYPEQMHGELIDPRLDGGEQYQYSHYETAHPGYAAPRTYEYSEYPSAHQQQQQQYYEEQTQSEHPGMATLTDGPDGWDQPGAEFDHALERWS